MNYGIVVLGIILVVILFVIYTYLNSSASTLTKQASLALSNPPIDVKGNPTTTRYAYGVWLFVNVWNTNSTKVVFSRALDNGENDIKLYINKNTPSLEFEINGTKKPVIITDNFPIQKWVYITISVDNMFVDFYLDGKLVKSVKLDAQPKNPSANTPIQLGSGFDAIAANFVRWSTPVNPQEVWSTYLAGNGGFFSKLIPNVNLKVSYVQNDTETKIM
jgi:hypothetical protein